MNEIDQLFIFGEIINPRNIKDFNSDASPLIKGKKATLDEAIKLIKKKIQKKEVHFSSRWNMIFKSNSFRSGKRP